MKNIPITTPIAFTLLLLSFLVSNHFPPWLSWQNEVLVFAAVLLLSWGLICKQWRQKYTHFSLPRLALVPLAFVLLAALQCMVGLVIYGGEVFVIFCYALLCTLCVILGYVQSATIHTEQDRTAATAFINALAWSLLIAAITSAFILLIQNFLLDAPVVSWLTYAASSNYKRPGGHLFQANNAATLQILGMASALFLQARGRFSNFTTAALVLLFGIGIAVTQSRTSVLSLCALLLWWTWKQPLIAPRTPRWAGAAISATILAIFMNWPKLFNFVHMMGEGSKVRGLSDVRLQLWQQFAQAVMQKPWLGWGMNQTATVHNAIADRYPPIAAFAYSHNLVLDMALWVGLPLTALLVVLTTVWLWRRCRATQSPLAWFGLALALPVGVHSMLEFPFAYAYFLAPAMLGLGLAEGAWGGRSLRLNTKVAAVILLLSTAFLAYSVVEYLRAEEDYRVVRFETIRVGRTPVTYEPPKMLLLTQFGAMFQAFRLPIKPNMAASDLALLRTVSAQNTTVALNSRYALALALNGRKADAERQLAVIRAQFGDRYALSACARLKAELQAHKMDWQPDCHPQTQSAK